MLQQDEPEDYVIATGEQRSVREFVEAAAAELGIAIAWRGRGVAEEGVVEAVDPDRFAQAADGDGAAGLRVAPGDVVVRVDPRYFRPAEVDELLGDATKARERLGWRPKVGFAELVREMVRADLLLARRDALCRREGFRTFERHE